jgi:hypothetical protein
MQHDSLRHDVAVSTAKHIVELFEGCLRDEEKHDAFIEVYVRVRSALEFFQIRAERMRERLHPGRN